MAAAELPTVAERVAQLEQQFGRGETYTAQQREAILVGLVPEWLYRVCNFHPDPQWRSHCRNLVAQLEIARADGFPAVTWPGENYTRTRIAPGGTPRLGKITTTASPPAPQAPKPAPKRAVVAPPERTTLEHRTRCSECRGVILAPSTAPDGVCEFCREPAG